MPTIIDTKETIDMMGGRFEVAAEFGNGEGATIVLRTRQPPGRLVPLHNHSPECIYVLDGTLQVWLEQPEPGWRDITSGQSLYLPAGIKHALRNRGDVPVDFLLLMDARLADFFREAGEPAQGDHPESPTPAIIRHTQDVAARYGFWIASPAEAEAIMGASGVPDAYLTQPKT